MADLGSLIYDAGNPNLSSLYASPQQGGSAPPPPPPPPPTTQGPPPNYGVQLAPGNLSAAQAVAQRQTADQQAPPTPPDAWTAAAGQALNRSVGTPQTQATTQTETGPKQINFAQGAQQGAAAQVPQLVLPNPADMLRTIPAHDVQLAPNAAVEHSHQATQEALGGVEDLTNAQVAENDTKAAGEMGKAGNVAAMAEKFEKAHNEKEAKITKALQLIDPRLPENQIDPNHYQSTMSAGRRMLLTAAAALTGFGSSLRGIGGKNPILEQMEEETNRDIDAQKHKLNAKTSLYAQLKDQGLSDEEAKAGVAKYYALAADKSIDATVAAAHSPVIAANGRVAKAQVLDAAAAHDAKLFGHVQATTTGAGTLPDIKRVRELRDKAADHGVTMTPAEAWRQAYAEKVGAEGGLQSYAKNTNAEHLGRQAGVQMEYQNNLNRYNAFLSQLDKAEAMVKQGGSLSAARTAEGKTLLHGMAAELGYVNAGKSPNETELATAESMLPTDLNAYQFTGADAAKLKQVRQMVEEKRAALMKSGPAVAGGQGFQPGQTTSQAAGDAGFTEEK